MVRMFLEFYDGKKGRAVYQLNEWLKQNPTSKINAVQYVPFGSTYHPGTSQATAYTAPTTAILVDVEVDQIENNELNAKEFQVRNSLSE